MLLLKMFNSHLRAAAVTSAQSSWCFPPKMSDVSQEEQPSDSSAGWMAEEVRSVNLRKTVCGFPVASAKHCQVEYKNKIIKSKPGQKTNNKELYCRLS